MTGFGTVLNVLTVLAGGGLGLALGARVPERARRTVLAALGLFTLAMGLRMFLQSDNPLITLGALLAGAVVGEALRIEHGLQGLGGWLHARFGPGNGAEGAGRFGHAFLTASLVFCVGPLTVLGSIQDGLSGDYSLLAIKSALDGFAALAFASALGVGVLFSVLVIAVYQGGLTLLAAQAAGVLSDVMVAEMTAAGGVILLGIAIGNLLELRPIRTGSLLPALLLAPLIVWLLQALGGG